MNDAAGFCELAEARRWQERLPPPLAPVIRRLRRRPVPENDEAGVRCFAGPRSVALRGRAYEHVAPPDADGADLFALAGGAGVTLGEFLTGSLPAAAAAMSCLPEARLAAPRLTPAQAGVLDRLGLAGRYLKRFDAEERAAGIMVRHTPPGACAADEDYVAMAARLRDPPAVTVPDWVAVLPAVAGQGFALRNRASLSAWLRARRVRLLAPEAEAFDRTAAALARATGLVLCDKRDAGLLGLCAPGMLVLEIAPEGWAGGTIRAACAVLGLEWRLFLATAPHYPVTRELPLGTTELLSYEIPIGTLGRVLDRL